MRAKFQVTEVGLHSPDCEEIKMRAVSDGAFDPEGNSEDSSFARWTPSGELSITITNPNLLGTFATGEKYYLHFTKAEG